MAEIRNDALTGGQELTATHEMVMPRLHKLALPIGVLLLSARPSRILKRLGIDTVGRLLDYSRLDLLYSEGFGKKSLGEIEKALDKLGLELYPPRKYPDLPGLNAGTRAVCSDDGETIRLSVYFDNPETFATLELDPTDALLLAQTLLAAAARRMVRKRDASP